jgi:hypothetical protein
MAKPNPHKRRATLRNATAPARTELQRTRERGPGSGTATTLVASGSNRMSVLLAFTRPFAWLAKRGKSRARLPAAPTACPMGPIPMDTAPIATSFFNRLLYETDPLEAVGILSDRWSVRARSTGPWLGLSRPEHQVSMVLIYVGEVGNGGHTQFFSNRGGDIATRLRAALRDIGLVDLDVLLEDAVAVFPEGEVPSDRAEVDRLLEVCSEGGLAELDRLDREVWRVDPYPRLIAYLRENERDVLRPERGLGAR